MTSTMKPPGEDQTALLIASNRLPLSLTQQEGEWVAQRSSGGLASALRGFAERRDFRWVGWPGCEVPASEQPKVTESLAEDGLVPVFLDEQERVGFYDRISNAVIWPLFHYFTSGLSYDKEAWRDYVAVNEQFAKTIAEAAAPHSRVWVHDYQLMLVPGLLRRARPDLDIGFFLHIPFPSSEVYRLLPVREELLKGVLGADYIGFHSHDYVRHFRASCLRVLGLETDLTGLDFRGRQIGLGAHPIGIDVAHLESSLQGKPVASRLEELETGFAGRRILLGVERLDYTKGLGHKLHAFETLLERRPDLVGEVTLIQVVVPSRLDSPRYQELKAELEETIGRINGRFGKPGYTPVEYLHRSVTFDHLLALYRFAHVCLVTPVRDGMNLVAQEFVLSQEAGPDDGYDNRGSLVLSEFAGAAQVLTSALLINPWDVDGTVHAIETALEMPAAERTTRTQIMVEQVRSLDCGIWARRFLESLERTAAESRSRIRATHLSKDVAATLRNRFLAAPRRLVILDYDGTLRELVRSPEDAQPTPEILALLSGLQAQPNTEVHVVSGRRRQDLDRWLTSPGIHLCAEHGFAWRGPHSEWRTQAGLDLSWIEAARTRLREVVDEVSGTRIELKPCSVAWHYRAADPEYGEWRARELHSQLEQEFVGYPVEILAGHRVIEVRATAVHKGNYVSRLLPATTDDTMILCAGDDRTDRDMYQALAGRAVAIHIGTTTEEATHWIESPRRLRHLLASLLDPEPTEEAPPEPFEQEQVQ